jgi:hypothetical protein
MLEYMVDRAYTLEIFIEPIRGLRPPRSKSSYMVTRRDGTLVKECPFINDDPKGRWARVDARGAINADAGSEVTMDEVNVVVYGDDT